jgi:VIT1/CCC1 family predicted Fe2+/Mn2+ transporter
VGAALPLLVTALVTALQPTGSLIVWISVTSLLFLAALGVLAAKAGGANPLTSAWRVTFWGALALAITAGVGKLFGAAV